MKNKKFCILSIAILLITITTVASYAYFSASVTNSSTVNDSVVTTGRMELEFTDGPEVTLSNGLPGSYVEKTFSVKNVGTVETTYDVYFSDIVNTFVDKSDLVYTLTSNDGGYNLSTQTEVPSRAAKMVDAYPIGVNETHTYTLRVDFLETNDNQDDNKGKKFKTIIRVNEFKTNESVLGFLDNQDYNETGEFIDTITANKVSYPVHVYNYVGNQTWTTETVPNGGIFGSAEDVGTASTNATRMVVVKVDGDLTIGSEVIIQPYYSSYGGPKGFMLYVTGTLTNNGKIDNSHGAKAVGENVYLWQNADYTSEADKFETVPAVGAVGGIAYTTSAKEYAVRGKTGNDGVNRQTGGGGSGSGLHGDSTGYSYVFSGGTGTSYSGGTGSGGINENSKEGPTFGREAGIDGGAGGVGRVYRYSTSWASRTACGGTGNPGGAGASHTSGNKSDEGNNNGYKGTDGTGGLLVIFVDSMVNNGEISANGTDSVNCTPAGGASGAGSINIFYNDRYVSNGQINAYGGNYDNSYTGGAGGNGSITIGSIETGTFVQNID